MAFHFNKTESARLIQSLMSQRRKSFVSLLYTKWDQSKHGMHKCTACVSHLHVVPITEHASMSTAFCEQLRHYLFCAEAILEPHMQRCHRLSWHLRKKGNSEHVKGQHLQVWQQSVLLPAAHSLA